MAKKVLIARQTKRVRLVAKFAAKRKALKEAGDYLGLALLPKNSSPVRLRNRCMLTGKPHWLRPRRFGLCRVKFRDLALAGKIPGVRKTSW